MCVNGPTHNDVSVNGCHQAMLLLLSTSSYMKQCRVWLHCVRGEESHKIRKPHTCLIQPFRLVWYPSTIQIQKTVSCTNMVLFLSHTARETIFDCINLMALIKHYHWLGHFIQTFHNIMELLLSLKPHAVANHML